jgi:alpha-beta hydrolase superfamily lysophospholipase
VPQFRDDYGVVITYHEWLADSPRAIIQLLHGLGEHALRYQMLAEELNAAGYSVIADDHRGHGRTGMAQWGGDRTKLGRLGPGGHRATVEAIRTLTGRIRSEHPGVPIVLLGHSWGSLLAQILLNSHPRDYDAVVLTGTAYRWPGSMNGGDLNKRHKHLGTTGAEWLSRDPAVSAAFYEDPLNFTADVLKLFGVVDGLRLFGRPGRRLPADLPLLILAGSDDALGGARSVQRLAESYVRRSGLRDVEAIVYDDARHEVFNEVNRHEVVADLLSWLDARVGERRSAG